MTKDELKEHAKLLGMKVRDGFMDDWFENLIVLVSGIAIGYLLFRLF